MTLDKWQEEQIWIFIDGRKQSGSIWGEEWGWGAVGYTGLSWSHRGRNKVCGCWDPTWPGSSGRQAPSSHLRQGSVEGNPEVRGGHVVLTSLFPLDRSRRHLVLFRETEVLALGHGDGALTDPFQVGEGHTVVHVRGMRASLQNPYQTPCRWGYPDPPLRGLFRALLVVLWSVLVAAAVQWVPGRGIPRWGVPVQAVPRELRIRLSASARQASYFCTSNFSCSVLLFLCMKMLFQLSSELSLYIGQPDIPEVLLPIS